jgi:hypothetical protein
MARKSTEVKKATAKKKVAAKKTTALKKAVAVKKTSAVKKITAVKPSERKKEFIVRSIFMIHVRRIGWLRTALGGGLMYLSIMEFIFLNLTFIVVLYQWMLNPFFRIKKFRIRDYILIDRWRVEGMMAFDRFNCDFCGYANGTAKLWNDQLDAISKADFGKGKWYGKAISGIYSICLAVFLVAAFIFSKILFALIALFLGYHWAGNRKAWRELVESDYAGKQSLILKWLVRCAKLSAGTLLTNLEQIETSWCPLKHIETRSAVNPDHHKLFFERDEVAEMYQALEKKGTVSLRRQKY